MYKSVIAIGLLTLTGCSTLHEDVTLKEVCPEQENVYEYMPMPKDYISADTAAVGFYTSNVKAILNMTNEQEMIGYIMKCNGGKYKYTTYTVQGLKYNLTYSVDPDDSCVIDSVVHTHPPASEGKVSDLFSKADLNASRTLPVYLLSVTEGNIRVTINPVDNRGRYIGSIDYSKFLK